MRSTVAKASGVLAAVAFVAAAYFGFRYVLGKDIGAECDTAGDCRAFWNARCLATDPRRKDLSYCTRACDADADCPAGWVCGQAYRIRAAALQGVVAVCVAPEQARDLPSLDARLGDPAELRKKVASAAQRVARRASEMGESELSRACFTIDDARYDCDREAEAMARARDLLTHVEGAKRTDLADSFSLLERTVSDLCPPAEK